MLTRYDQVLNHLTSGRSLTQGEAITLGYGTRLAATIHDLKKRGHKIETVSKRDLKGIPYAEYQLRTTKRNGDRRTAK